MTKSTPVLQTLIRSVGPRKVTVSQDSIKDLLISSYFSMQGEHKRGIDNVIEDYAISYGLSSSSDLSSHKDLLATHLATLADRHCRQSQMIAYHHDQQQEMSAGHGREDTRRSLEDELALISITSSLKPRARQLASKVACFDEFRSLLILNQWYDKKIDPDKQIHPQLIECSKAYAKKLKRSQQRDQQARKIKKAISRSAEYITKTAYGPIRKIPLDIKRCTIALALGAGIIGYSCLSDRLNMQKHPLLSPAEIQISLQNLQDISDTIQQKKEHKSVFSPVTALISYVDRTQQDLHLARQERYNKQFDSIKEKLQEGYHKDIIKDLDMLYAKSKDDGLAQQIAAYREEVAKPHVENITRIINTAAREFERYDQALKNNDPYQMIESHVASFSIISILKEHDFIGSDDLLRQANRYQDKLEERISVAAKERFQLYIEKSKVIEDLVEKGKLRDAQKMQIDLRSKLEHDKRKGLLSEIYMR